MLNNYEISLPVLFSLQLIHASLFLDNFYKMAKVHLLNVTVHNNPAPFFTPFQFEIHFECLEELQDGKKIF